MHINLPKSFSCLSLNFAYLTNLVNLNLLETTYLKSFLLCDHSFGATPSRKLNGSMHYLLSSFINENLNTTWMRWHTRIKKGRSKVAGKISFYLLIIIVFDPDLSQNHRYCAVLFDFGTRFIYTYCQGIKCICKNFTDSKFTWCILWLENMFCITIMIYSSTNTDTWCMQEYDITIVLNLLSQSSFSELPRDLANINSSRSNKW